jgi:hypothetical protein
LQVLARDQMLKLRLLYMVPYVCPTGARKSSVDHIYHDSWSN